MEKIIYIYIKKRGMKMKNEIGGMRKGERMK